MTTVEIIRMSTGLEENWSYGAGKQEVLWGYLRTKR